ncbi:HNH endonuclease [Aeromonas enteropelogenes]|uniref:HNH endonuclease n=1 Tax=Aeromonas enteropelogenes TaxID=29489 RepID=UPI003BA1A63C
MWVVYVSNKPDSKRNFEIGMNAGVWGVHDSKKSTIQNVKKDEMVMFVHAISWLKANGPMPDGFSRVKKTSDFKGLVRRIVFGRVTKSFYESEEAIWPDASYPNRFNFEVIQEHKNNVFFGTEFYDASIVEAVRYSACHQGAVSKVVTEYKSIEEIEKPFVFEDSAKYSVVEGQEIYRLHKTYERSSKIVEEKKRSVLEEKNKLECEVCDADFHAIYGEHGKGFAECHHVNPLAFRDGEEETKLEDLIILCANCHRMIHRKKQWLTVDELKGIYNNAKFKS